MNLLEAIRTSITEILTHKLRSLLTLVGIVLGTASLVVMVSVIGGVAVAVQKGISDLGFDGVVFISGRESQDRLERKRPYSPGLTRADLETINSGRELISEAAPVVSTRDLVRINGREVVTSIDGVTPAWGRIRNRSAEVGRYVADADVEHSSLVAVIGKGLKEEAFGTEEAIGRELVVRGVRFKIVGVLRSLGNSQVQSGEMRRDNRKVFVPLTTAQKYFTGSDRVAGYAVLLSDVDRLADGSKEAEALLRRSHRGITDFRVNNIAEEIVRVRSEIDKLLSNWRVVLASIAGISLLVGGIGIFSVMQISISERLFEIGLRKSIGASDGVIFSQFLIESISLSLVGGLLGASLGFVITILAGQAFEDGLAVSPAGLLLAAAFALAIGLGAGLYPALRASRLAPVEALRV